MKRLQSFLLLFITLLLPLAVQAQTNGTISGKVTDAGTQLPLGGVRVSIVNTALETYTARDGGFTLLNVPVGEQTLSYSYVGYP